ncbi:hypothetical protein [Bifidobacterium simiarum]|uniref:hypothetical protein n=1 Tax=Bifidobacterium simiarum TaxID=2045441 RepID=UPI001BDD38BC|nr:hypothetical protein [Bifidobacterium simiarum]MBT1165671.1 hypothetical protein [Bifidobacterium simiarum]
MTANKDSNATPSASNTGPDGHGSRPDDEAAWADFMASHSEDLNDVARSRSARKFDRAAKKAEKQARFDVRDLKAEAFAGNGPNAGGFAGAGPRDHTGRSWLDVDEVMDEGSPFTPPNPEIGSVRKATLLFVALLVLGVLCLALALFVPGLSSLFGAAGGVMTLLGAAGLFARHRGHSETRADIFDDGARV